MKFLLDASFLVSAVRFKVDVTGELSRFGRPEPCILDAVVEELKRIASGRGKDAACARTAMEFIGKHEVEVIPSEEPVADSSMLELSGKGFIVCTADRELLRKIRKSGGKAVSIRQGRYLELV